MDGTFLLLLVLVSAQLTEAQTTNSTFTFPDFAATTASSATKIFTTNVTFIPKSANQSTVFESAIFLNATAEFYSSVFPGFMAARIIRNVTNFVNQIAASHDVVYEVTYNYTNFIVSAASDSAVPNTIGNLASVKNGLEQSTSLNALYNVSDNSTLFSFTGNRICPSSSCGSSYVFCTESSLGLTPLCRSTCFSSFVCQNGGYCVHRASRSSPNCNCLGSSSVWYLGGRCEYKVEVWMIVVFVLGFVLIIALIIFIGFLCCRRKPKPAKREPFDEPRGLKRGATVGNDAIGERKSPQTRKAPQGYVEESNPVSLYPASPMTSNALVTVQESSHESSESSVSAEPRELSEEEDAIEETTLPELSSRAPRREESIVSADSGNRSEVLLSGVASRDSVADSDNQSRRYNSLQFPDSSGQRTAEAERGYNTLGAASKSTQTNTKINIELPDSILMNRL